MILYQYLNMKTIRLLSLCVCIKLSLLTIINGTYSDEDVEYVTVHKLSGDVIRSKRSSETDFPAQFDFLFEMTSGNVSMQLSRSVPVEHMIPIYTLHGNNRIEKHSDGAQKTYAVYQDERLGASVIVKCIPVDLPNNLQIFGSFTHNGQHYQIEPDVALNRKRRSDDVSSSGDPTSGDTASLKHRVKRQSNPYGDFLGDELLPPPDTSGLNRPPMMPPYPSDTHIGTANEVPLIKLEERKPESLQTESVTGEQHNLLNEGFNRHRRDASETVYIEYMAVIDYKNMERWMEYVGGATFEDIQDNAFDAMQEYYQFVVNGIDVRFRTATSNGPVIRVNLTNILVSTESATSPWIANNMLTSTSIDDAGVLLDFAMWRSSMIDYLPRHDHAGLFTGFDIATPTSTNPIGMGYLNSICHNTWAVSEIEETYNAVTIHIAAHELGHNIGTRHDGNGNGCASSSLYLMAPRLPTVYDASIRTNPWTFSTCSQNAIKTFIDGLGSDNCLTDTPAKRNVGNEQGGQIYDVDKQCNMTFGDDAVLCRDNLYNQLDSVCYAMQCKKKGSNSCEGRFFPFDGTPCGNKKWCQSGLCVYSDLAPVADEQCLFGDDPNVDCTLSDACDENNAISRTIRCCGTCLMTTPPPPTKTTTTSTTSTTPSTTTTSSSLSSTKSSSSTTTATATSTTTSTTPPTTSRTTSSSSSTLSSTAVTSSTSSSTKTSPTTTLSSTTQSPTSSTTETPTTSTFTTTTPTKQTATISTPTTKTISSTSTTTTTATSSTTSSTTPPSTSTPTSTSTESTKRSSPLPTSTTTSPSSTTESVDKETPELELSFDLQTMISLFVASAIAI